MTSTDPSKALLMQHFFWHIIILRRNFEERSKIWPSLSPPHEVDLTHKQSRLASLLKTNAKTASSTSGNRPFLGPVNFLRDTSHPLITALCFRHSRTLLPLTPKIAVALWFPFSSAHRITSRMNFAVYDSLLDFWCPFHNYSTRQTGISIFHVSTTNARADFRRNCTRLLRKAWFTVPVRLIGLRRIVGFERTGNTQYYSVSCHVGMGWLKERRVLESRTNFFPFKNAKTWVRTGFKNIR
jgi:hypothetical protein